ncbi:hypothetical protein B0H13DRAFT_1882381 [Mycena leptocephala]|nr:hypothetical protein B0H13DRAFT_1882381 [Mycena leptocephala]
MIQKPKKGFRKERARSIQQGYKIPTSPGLSPAPDPRREGWAQPCQWARALPGPTQARAFGPDPTVTTLGLDVTVKCLTGDDQGLIVDFVAQTVHRWIVKPESCLDTAEGLKAERSESADGDNTSTTRANDTRRWHAAKLTFTLGGHHARAGWSQYLPTQAGPRTTRLATTPRAMRFADGRAHYGGFAVPWGECPGERGQHRSGNRAIVRGEHRRPAKSGAQSRTRGLAGTHGVEERCATGSASVGRAHRVITGRRRELRRCSRVAFEI